MSVLVYVSEGRQTPFIIGVWSTVEEACHHADTILTSGAFTHVIITTDDAHEHGKSSPTALPTERSWSAKLLDTLDEQ